VPVSFCQPWCKRRRMARTSEASNGGLNQMFLPAKSPAVQSYQWVLPLTACRLLPWVAASVDVVGALCFLPTVEFWRDYTVVSPVSGVRQLVRPACFRSNGVLYV
jgi:hypothetical protein